MIELLIGGDVCPRGRNLKDFSAGNAEKIFSDLLKEMHEADLSIINLESPLIERKTPIAKVGSTLGAPVSCVKTLEHAKIDVVNLANNHIFDHGETGLLSTIKQCKNAGISTVGAGKNQQSAQKILIKKVEDIRIGILGICHREYSLATKNSPGANPADFIEFVKTTQRNSKDYDFLLVLYHAGSEHYQYPSPQLQRNCRFMIEMGAGAIIVQHTHCPGCWENFKGRHIIYGQGNLIFDHPNAPIGFYEGFLTKIGVSKRLETQMEIIPYFQSKNGIGAKRMQPSEAELFIKLLMLRSEAIKNDFFVQKRWNRYCLGKKHSYLNRLLSYNKILAKVNKNGWLYKFCYSERIKKRLQNIILCETHREVIKTLYQMGEI
jgi:capsule synthesis protein PGA_cap